MLTYTDTWTNKDYSSKDYSRMRNKDYSMMGSMENKDYNRAGSHIYLSSLMGLYHVFLGFEEEEHKVKYYPRNPSCME